MTPNSEPLDPSFPADSGRQLARIDVVVCAGSSGLVVSAQDWFATTTDARIGTASSFGTTFPSAELAAGQCGSGLIDLDLSADAPHVILTPPTLREWQPGSLDWPAHVDR